MQRHALHIAVVAPREPCPMVDDLAAGLAARGHRVRLHDGKEGYDKVFRRLHAERPDAVSQHASAPEAFALAEGLPVVHTVHVPPSPVLAAVCASLRARLVASSSCMARAWQAAGVGRIQVIVGGVADFPLLPAVVRPLALVADRTGAVAALRAGLGIVMLGTLGRTREELWRKLAHCAVCVAGADERGVFDWIAAQAQLAGCAVVGQASGALPEIVEDGVSGFLVAPGDEPALAAAVRRALPLDRHAVRESARARLALEPMLARYESELRAIARRSAVRLVA